MAKKVVGKRRPKGTVPGPGGGGTGARPARRRRAFAVAAVLIAAAAAGVAWLVPRLVPAPEISRLETLAPLDPAVRNLVEQRLAAVEADPRDPRLHGSLGVVYEANLLWEPARRAFAAAARLDPDDPLWRLHMAIATRQGGNAAGALLELREVAAAAPELAPAQQRLGLALLEGGDVEGARAAFERLAAIAPRSAEGSIGIAEVLLREGKAGAAIPPLVTAVGLEPGNRRAHYLLGLAYRAAGREIEAQREMALGVDSAVNYLPDPLTPEVQAAAASLTARNEAGLALLQAGRPEEAIRLLQGVLADHPDNITVLNNLAIAFMHGGELETARNFLERARQVDDRKFSTYINLSSWAMRSGQPRLALEFADGAVARGAAVARAHATRAQALLRLERVAEAVASLERALELDFRDVQVLLNLGAAYGRLGHHADALATFDRLALLQPALLPAHLGRALSALDSGRPDVARGALETARRLAPEHPQLLELERRLAAGDGA